MHAESLAHRLTGQWVGATQGYASPAHVWEITMRGSRLRIATRWEGQQAVTPLDGSLLTDGAGFSISAGRFRAILLGPQHFVVPGWDTNDTRGGKGPSYDVIFSRPGLAELAAPAAYRRYLTSAGGA